MKEDNKHLKKKDQKLLIGIAAVIVVLIIALCVLLVRRNTGNQSKWDADYLTGQMEQAGWDYLPDDPDQIREIAEAALSVLNSMGTDADRAQVEEALKDAILQLGYDLTEEEAGELAEWLTSLYLNGTGTAGTTDDRTNTVSSSVYNQIKADLDEMAAYLEQLDESVTHNRTELENLTINQQSNLDALQEYLTSLADTVADLQKSVSSLEQSYAEIAGNSSTELTNISTLLGSIYENIANTQNEILVDLTNAELNSQEKYESIQESISNMTSSVITEVEEVNDSVEQVFNSLLADNDENTATIAKNLQETKNTITTLLEELENTSLDQFTQMEENNAARYEATAENLRAMQASLETVLAELKAESSTQYQALSQAIENTRNSISNTLSDMEAGNMERDTKLNQRLTDLFEELQTVHEGLSSQLTQMQEEQNNQNEALKIGRAHV